jgi:hypothetical protein
MQTTNPVATMKAAVHRMTDELAEKANGMREAIEHLAALRSVAQAEAQRMRTAVRVAGVKAVRS